MTTTPAGSQGRPLRVAVVGAGPAGFFTAEALLKCASPVYDVDVIERLPTPFGLVRSGVAPDHQQIKNVHKVFEKTAAHGRFRFLGNVQVGRDVTVAELAKHYDQVVYAVGSAADRRLGLPGEELDGSHAATAFVGWYNAHPDFVSFPFDLQHGRAVIVGIGNVAMDVARVLLRDTEELAKTDIASPALEALRQSKVREVVLLARRGPAQAAFDIKELKAIEALHRVRVVLDKAQLEAELSGPHALDAEAKKSLEGMLAIANAPPKDADRTLRLEFLASPTELLADGKGHLRAVRIERNHLVVGADGERHARPTGTTWELEAGLVFRAVGYRGVPIDGLPFDDQKGTIPNRDGRVLDGDAVRPGHYAVGWCRRGPTGVIGTNKQDANTLAERIIADAATLPPGDAAARTHGALDALLASRDVHVTSFADWSKLDAVEVTTGREKGKVREKFMSVEQMMNHLLRTTPPASDPRAE